MNFVYVSACPHGSGALLDAVGSALRLASWTPSATRAGLCTLAGLSLTHYVPIRFARPVQFSDVVWPGLMDAGHGLGKLGSASGHLVRALWQCNGSARIQLDATRRTSRSSTFTHTALFADS